VVFRVSFADKKSRKSPQVKTLNAGHFFWAGVGDGGAGDGAAKRTYVLCEVQVKCEV